MSFSFIRSDPQYADGVEREPELDRHLESSVPGLHIAGAAKASPLLKTCINEGVEVIRSISRLQRPGESGAEFDVVIVGAGPTGLAAALEAKKRGFSTCLLEKQRPLETIRNFPAGKHVYAEPAGMATLGGLWLEDATKEELLQRWGASLDELDVQTGKEVTGVARVGRGLEVRLADGQTVSGARVVLAVGRMGNPRQLGVPGEELDCVYSALLNPGKYADRDLVVIGGGNSAAEAAIALVGRNRVTLVHRDTGFPRLNKDNRRKLETAERAGQLRVLLQAQVASFEPGQVVVVVDDHEERLTADAAFVLIGTQPPLAFLKKLGVRLEGAWTPGRLLHLGWVFGLVYAIYGIKNGLWPFGGVYAGMQAAGVDPGLLYGLLYSVLMTVFGLKALRRWREDPYQRKRYGTYIAAQWLVYFALPWLLWFAFAYPEYWRTWAVSLTYPLGYYGLWEPAGKLVSDSVLPWTVGVVLAFAVFMPVFSAFHGKRFCAWFCPCGGLADTVGDAWRHRAPRGKPARAVEISSTVILIATLLGSLYLISGYRDFIEPGRFKSAYKWVVDIGLASVVAITLYPFKGGRIWCRFFCPLAKWMELWGRWTGGKLAIVPNDECISCGECTKYCQMGIDVRAFAQRQWPLSNATTCCIFCGICVSVCPVDVLRVARVPGGTRKLAPIAAESAESKEP